MTKTQLFFRKLWDLQNLTMIILTGALVLFVFLSYESFTNPNAIFLMFQILFPSMAVIAFFVIVKIGLPAMKDLWSGGWDRCGLMGFDLVYEKGSETIRTIPENYYVATVMSNKLMFQDLETKTKYIHKPSVFKWFVKNHKKS